MSSSYMCLEYLWDDKKAGQLSPVERLVYRSNLLGSDQKITNTGGGNTSSKIRPKRSIIRRHDYSLMG